MARTYYQDHREVQVIENHLRNRIRANMEINAGAGRVGRATIIWVEVGSNWGHGTNFIYILRLGG